MPIVFTIALGVCAGAYVIGAKRNAGPPRILATMSASTTADIPSTTNVATASVPAAPQNSSRQAPIPPNSAPQNAESAAVAEPPAAETIRKPARKKSAHGMPRPGLSSMDNRPSGLEASPAPSATEPPPTAPTGAPPAVPPPARPAMRVDPAAGRVVWKVVGVAGGATAGDVARAVERISGPWNECYQSGLRARTANIEGAATLHLSCDDQGRVVGATVSGFDMPDVAACIRARSMGITIPNADTGEPSATIALSFAVRN